LYEARLQVKLTVTVLGKSDFPRPATVNYWVALSQITYGELLEQTRNPQVGG
jgi:hypothetical protein